MSDEPAMTLAAVEQRLREARVERPGEEAARILARAEEDGDPGRALGLAEQRAAGAPLGYVLGKVRFLGVELAAAPGVLAPRPDTELVALRALQLLAALSADGRGLKVIDMCCGAGNLACALASALAGLEVLASDLTEGSVALTRRNVTRLGLAGRVQVERGDLFAPFDGKGLEGGTQVVVCNPPYISTSRIEGDRASLLKNEPREAFDGGPYGLTIHARVIAEAQPFLRAGGWLVCEIGTGQGRQVRRLLERARCYTDVELVTDGGGEPRVAYGRKQAG